VIARAIHCAKSTVYVAFYLISKATLKPEISILLYHSIGSNASRYSLSVEDFYRQMDYLRKNYNIVSLLEIENFVEGRKSLPKKSVAITFDDGFLDNYLNAYPYLKKYNMPATIFVATGHVNKKMLLYPEYVDLADWDAIKTMSENNIEIGAHTVRHPNLTQIDINEAKKEIIESREEIEKTLGKKVAFFAYPFGAYNDNVVKLVKSLGFKGAVGGEGVIQENSNVFLLNRSEVAQPTSFIIFKARLTMAIVWYKKFEQIVKNMLRNSPFIYNKISVTYRNPNRKKR